MSGDTIFALASGSARAAICVVRVSGGRTADIVGGLCGSLPAARRASLRRLRDASGNELDRGIVIWLPGPDNYTGEDAAELHLHGGRAVLAGVTAALLSLGARPAEPGEFSRRAFLAGRMDLLEAEAVADLVSAQTEAQRLQALRQLSGTQSAVVSGWASRLKRVLAFQEALIDFPDENLPESVEAGLLVDMRALADEVRARLAEAPAGQRLRQGLVFAIVGAPNVGKSSLLNALARRDIAIVSPIPGTTRDTLEVEVDLAGVPVTLIDTAGLRETADPVEAEGVRRARTRAETADLVLNVVDAANPGPFQPGSLVVANKIDLAATPAGAIGVSVLTGAGFAALEAVLAGEAMRLTGASVDPLVTRARHVAALRDALAGLEAAIDCDLAEVRAEELRLALRGLGRVTGAVDAESILDDVFGAFCIGK